MPFIKCDSRHSFFEVDKHLRLEGAPNIYAAGDILFDPMFSSSGPHAVTGERLPERIGGGGASLNELGSNHGLKRRTVSTWYTFELKNVF